MVRSLAWVGAILACGVMSAISAGAQPIGTPPQTQPASADLMTSAPLAAPPQGVTLSSHVIEEASRYRAYMRKVKSLVSRFDNGAAIEATLSEAESYEPQQLIRGAVAYGAVMALQDPAFVASVRVFAANPASRADVAERLLADPTYADVLPGAATAADLIRASLHRQSFRLMELGGSIKQAAYSIQKEKSWSKTSVTDPQGRLSRAKELSSQSMELDSTEMKAISDALVDGSAFVREEAPPNEPPPASATPFTGLINRSLALAALAVLGSGGDDNDAALQNLMGDASSGYCLSMSKLNLYQCLAVARPWYEDMFCLGLHAISDTGECIAKAAGEQPIAPQPYVAANTPRKTKKSRTP